MKVKAGMPGKPSMWFLLFIIPVVTILL